MVFSKDQDAFLANHYNQNVRVDPACLAMSLDIRHVAATRMVEKRLRELGLRKAESTRVKDRK